MEKEEAEGRKARHDEVQEVVSLGFDARRGIVSEKKAILERIRMETWEELTDIKVKFDDQENQRRIIEENNRLDRYDALQI